jgi:allantoinase
MQSVDALTPNGIGTMLREPSRYNYLPLIDRPKIRWPKNARIAFWVCPNVEFYELDPPDGQGRPIWPRPTPDTLNYSLRDYGNRSGIWRVMEAMEKFGVRASVSLNAAMCDHMPEIVDECVRLNWELFSHGIYNTRLIYGMTEDDVRQVISDSINTIKRHSGRTVAGWLAPALSSTETFFDLLPEFGIKYAIDMTPDDQPIPIKVRHGKLIAIPYSTEINDIRVMGIRGYPADKWTAMIKACFDQLYEEGEENGTVMCVPLHPFVVGQPHRISALHDVLRHVTSHADVWLATAGEISDWYYQNHYDEAVNYQANARAPRK